MMPKENLINASDDDIEKAIRSVKEFKATTMTTAAGWVFCSVSITNFQIIDPTLNCSGMQNVLSFQDNCLRANYHLSNDTFQISVTTSYKILIDLQIV